MLLCIINFMHCNIDELLHITFVIFKKREILDFLQQQGFWIHSSFGDALGRGMVNVVVCALSYLVPVPLDGFPWVDDFCDFFFGDNVVTQNCWNMKLAKRATTNIKIDQHIPIAHSFIKKILKTRIRSEWRTYWDTSDSGRHTYDIISKVSHNLITLTAYTISFL